MNLSNFHTDEGVYIITPNDNQFIDSYINVRTKENRFLIDNQVIELPFVSSTNIHFNEWQLRQKTAARFLEYEKTKNRNLTILDVGCGNGWFTNKMAEIENTIIVGLDVNTIELKQASRVFKKENLNFVSYDIFKKEDCFDNEFDIITLNASVQYFSDFNLLITTLKRFLKKNGEIHIMDSPFYKKNEIEFAKKRTLDYYTKIGFPKMADFYFHHSIALLIDFDILYRPKKGLLNKIININNSPFMWLKL